MISYNANKCFYLNIGNLTPLGHFSSLFSLLGVLKLRHLGGAIQGQVTIIGLIP